MVVVHILGGPRDGERFATPLHGLTERIRFRDLDDKYVFTRDPRTGRWRAIPAQPGGNAG
jgi:hypothetical protein